MNAFIALSTIVLHTWIHPDAPRGYAGPFSTLAQCEVVSFRWSVRVDKLTSRVQFRRGTWKPHAMCVQYKSRSEALRAMAQEGS